MREDKYKRVTLELFLSLAGFTIAFMIFKLRNPYIFLGAEQKLLLFTMFFGVLTMFFYLNDILHNIKKAYHYIMAIFSGRKAKKSLKRLKKKRKLLNLRGIKKSIENYKIILEIVRKYSKKAYAYILKNTLKSCLIGTAIILYSYFLYLLSRAVSIDELAFFILLAYIPISLKLKLDERYPIAIALLLLILCAITLAQGFEDYANMIAVYTYYFLVIGVILLFIGHVRSSHSD